MSITAITIENFKGIREPVRVELKPITLLFGPNSAGKSTIVQALHYAHEIFERQNLNPDRTLLGGDSIDLGGFENLVNQHDLKRPVIFRFELDLSGEDLPDYKDGYEELEHWSSMEADDEIEQKHIDLFQNISSKANKAEVAVTIRWSNTLEKPIISSYAISINDIELAEVKSSDDTRQIELSRFNIFNFVFYSDEEIKIIMNPIRKALAAEDYSEAVELVSKLGLMESIGWVIDTDKINPFFLTYGENASISLHEQTSAMPVWGKPLTIDTSLWNEEASSFNEWGFFIKMLSSLITGPGELVRDELRKLCYVGPLREVPKRGHKPVTSPEESRWANGLAAYDTLFFAEDNFIDKVNEWLTQEERLNSGYSVELKKYRELETDNPVMLAALQGRILDEDIDLSESLLALPVKRRLLIRDAARGIELVPQDIGTGISQVLPVVVAALHRKTGLVAIEQPELHIHPAFQVALGDLFIEQVRQRPDLTFILETHSEHLMLRFLRRVRETGENEAPENRTLSPNELSIYFIEQHETGISCLPIRVDEDGDFIDHWPHGFFSERSEELF